MIHTQQLAHSFSPESTFEFPDISCDAGKSLLILGPSGCGKSTLLHLICGLIRPNKGSIKIMNTDVASLSGSKMDAFRGEHIGVILQKPYFISSLTVIDNLFLFQTLTEKKPNRDYIFELLDTLGLKGKEKQMTYSLSQGEAQRLNFARALIHQPALILADEPTAALDDKNAMLIASLLQKHSESLNASLVIVTHDKRLQSFFPNHIFLS